MAFYSLPQGPYNKLGNPNTHVNMVTPTIQGRNQYYQRLETPRIL
jgi:hypothetical protein